MLPRLRHEKILELLEEGGAVRTIDLAERFSVTDETIRRDLEALHSEGRLVRTHGGAIATDHPGRNIGLSEREVLNLPLKKQIARAAEQYLQPGDVIYLDGSSTALQFAKSIPSVDLTVLTNAHGVIDALKDREEIEVIGTGGKFDAFNGCYGGSMAAQALGRYRIKTAFFSANGIDLKRGLSESDEEQADLKRGALQLVETAVFLGDSTKIGVSSTFFFAPLDRVGVWITDSEASEYQLRPFRQQIRSVVVAPH